jgi:RNA polymerase sigma-70 factor (ECF subfamily)
VDATVRRPAERGGGFSEPELASLLRGDRAVFGRLVAIYDERLRALAYHLLGSREAMDDALQETYLAAYRGLSGFRGDSSLGTWLYRITYTTCLQRLRKVRAMELVPLEGQERVSVASGSEEQVAVRDELRRALSELSPERCASVLLVLRDGFTYAEAAAALGVPQGTVASRVAAGRDQLVARLGSRKGGVRW